MTKPANTTRTDGPAIAAGSWLSGALFPDTAHEALESIAERIADAAYGYIEY